MRDVHGSGVRCNRDRLHFKEVHDVNFTGVLLIEINPIVFRRITLSLPVGNRLSELSKTIPTRKEGNKPCMPVESNTPPQWDTNHKPEKWHVKSGHGKALVRISAMSLEDASHSVEKVPDPI